MHLVTNHHCICQICLYVLTHYITTEREVQQIWALSYQEVAHKMGKRRFSHEAAAYWNQLPNIVRQAPSKGSFANLYWKMVP